jgi:hypothetical protein
MAWDPINLRDPSGRRIRVGTLGDRDRLQLVLELRSITGLDLDVCSVDEAYHSHCVPGDLIIRGPENESSAPRYSRLGQSILVDAINDPSIIDVEANSGSEVGFGEHPVTLNAPGARARSPRRTEYNFSTGTISLDFFDFPRQSGPPDVLSAHSVGLTFFHELLHHVVIGSRRDTDSIFGLQYETLSDTTGPNDPLGSVEPIVNRIRRQLGLPERKAYREVTGDKEGQRCLIFSTGRVCYETNQIHHRYPQ